MNKQEGKKDFQGNTEEKNLCILEYKASKFSFNFLLSPFHFQAVKLHWDKQNSYVSSRMINLFAQMQQYNPRQFCSSDFR